MPVPQCTKMPLESAQRYDGIQPETSPSHTNAGMPAACPYVSCNYFPLREISYYMRIIIYILFLCAVPAVAFGQQPLSSSIHKSMVQGDAEDSLYLYKKYMEYEYAKDFRRALDTCRLYVELHPFATNPPGEALVSISNTIFYTGSLPNRTQNDWILNHNWLVKIYPNNTEQVYKMQVWRTMASNMENFDLNEAANLWYNYSLVYNDTQNVAVAWKRIKSIRNYQKQIPLDTTPFHVISFPPDPIISGVAPVAHSSNPIEITISPNPAKTETELSFSLEERSAIRVELFDVLGRSVKKVYTGMLDEGKHTYPVSISVLAEGMYYVRVTANDVVTTKSMRVVK